MSSGSSIGSGEVTVVSSACTGMIGALLIGSPRLRRVHVRSSCHLDQFAGKWSEV